ncbi:alanine racemase, partial [Corynebacterium bovis]
GVVGPALFDHYRAFAPRPAEWFVVPVVRRPAADVVTVAGGGRIASGPPGTDRVPVVDHPEGLRLTRLEGAGEVQTPLRGAAARRLRLGDGVWFRHAKAGEQAEHTDRVVVVSGGDIIDHWPTYRGEGMTFL